MPKMSVEQRRIQREAEEAAEKLAKEAFRLTMPSRLMQLFARAQGVNISANIRLITSGVEMTVYHDSHPHIDSTLTYDSEEWEVEMVEDSIDLLKADIDARQARRELAQDVWTNKLSPVERAALKEFIHSLY